MDLIPLPVDDAFLDFVILPAMAGLPKQSDMMQILLAAAHRTVVDTDLGVLREASLRAIAFDPAATAGIRATERITAEADGTVALVDLGADLTVISVRTAGRIRFSRILNSGGGDVTDRVAARLTLAQAEAERLKRTPGSIGGAAIVLAADIEPLVSQIESSLSFFSDQMGDDAVRGVLLTGGGARNPELVGQLVRRLPVPVVVLDALEGLECGDLDLDEEARALASATGLVAIGAAEWVFDQPARRLSLLPLELAKAAAARRQLVLAGVGVAVLAAALTMLSLTRAHQTELVNRENATVQLGNAATQTRITQLAPTSALLAAVQTRVAQTKADQANNIAWTALVARISGAMPPHTSLKSLNLTDTQVAGVATTTAGSAAAAATLGSISMSVTAHGTVEQVAIWLRALDHLPGISTVWVPTGTAIDGEVSFSSTAVLSAGVPLVVRDVSVGGTG